MDGKPIVLTASTIEMSDFHLNQFMAFTGGFPSKIVPRRILRKHWYPVTENDGGRAIFAPYGLRKVEALLLEEFGEDNVVVCTPYELERWVGSDTKVVGVSTMDPLGIGFVSRTYTSLVGLGDEPLAAAEFKELVNHPVLKRYDLQIIVGGSGAWEIIRGEVQDEYGIDVVVMGEGERDVLDIFRKAVEGEKLPSRVETKKPTLEEIPTIKRAALFGVVEITRGCGRGCKFCSPTMRTKYSFPLEMIKQEALLNARAGSKMITLQTDDVFLYKCKEQFKPNRDALVGLIEMLGKIDGIEYLQPAHAALAPVVYDPKIVEEIAPILVDKGRWTLNGKRVASVEIGIETGSVRLMSEHMRGKVLPYKPEDWPEIVPQAIGILNDNDICPLATLITGLPGEKEEDTIATMELIDELKGSRMFYVPLLFTSEDECLLRKARQADLRDLTEQQWDFIATCWRHNTDLWVSKWRMPMMMLGSLFAYFLYYRWKHGPKVIYPMMKFCGFPEAFYEKVEK